MTTDLFYLALTAMLSAALWIPYVVCQVMTNGFLQRPNYVDPAQRPVPLWGQRASRAHLNSVETLAPFAVLILIAHITGKAGHWVEVLAVTFFWIRLAYSIVYLAAIPYLRTILFTLGFATVVCLFCHLVF